MVAGALDAGVCLLEFTERRMLEAQFDTLRQRFQMALVLGETAHLEQLRAELGEYFARTRREFTVPLAYPGTPFERQVFRAGGILACTLRAMLS